jgi:hypothetical protein
MAIVRCINLETKLREYGRTNALKTLYLSLVDPIIFDQAPSN